MKNKIIIISILLILVIVGITMCRKIVLNSNKQQTIDSLTLANQNLSTVISQKGNIIDWQHSIIVDNTNALNSLTDSIFDLKKKDRKNQEVLAYYKGTTKVHLSNFIVPRVDDNEKTYKISDFIENTVVIDSSQSEFIGYIKVPAHYVLNNQDLAFSATIDTNKLVVDDFIVYDTLQMRFVEKRHGLFKPHTIEVQYFHTSPYMQTDSGNSVIYQPKSKNKFLNWLIPALVGLAGGIYLAK